jgi:multicomponent Na+:H+ antiporter subunit E
MSAWQPAAPAPSRSGPLWRAALLRAVIFAALWWILTEGVLRGWTLALVSIAAAVATSLLLVPPATWRWRLGGLVRFIPFFLWQSSRGGVDVARRALHPRLPILPGEFLYALRLPDGAARTFFTAALSLLPGTLSLELRDDEILIHTLDQRLRAPELLRRLEDRVADLFGVEPL